MVRMAGSLVSGEETDTINLSLEMTATPETPISHFLRRSPDKYSTPILSNMIPLAFAGYTDTGDDTNHIPISRGNYKPTTHHATTPSNNPYHLPPHLRTLRGPPLHHCPLPKTGGDQDAVMLVMYAICMTQELDLSGDLLARLGTRLSLVESITMSVT